MHDVFRERCALPSDPRAGCFGSCIDLEEIEILVLLPFRRLLALLPAAVLEPLCKAAGFVALEAKEIIEKQLSGLRAEQPLVLEGVQRGRQALGQQRPLRAVRLLVRWSRIKAFVHALDAGDDL